MNPQRSRICLCLAFMFLTLTTQAASAQQRQVSLRGQVTDELGGAVVGAVVIISDSGGAAKTTTTNDEGVYAFTNLAPGEYTVRAEAIGFAAYKSGGVTVSPAGRGGSAVVHNIKLGVTLESQEVTVSANSSLSTESENNADTIVLRGKDLDLLPDDPDALAAAVQAMSGPSVGPNGGQIFIDGFTGGRLPPKESIREVRVNQNPFNAENDRPFFGRVDILTKPGTDQLRGSMFYNFEDESLNSRNPFSPFRAPYQTRYYGGTLSGTVIPKKASFFLDVTKRSINDNQLINAIILDASLTPTSFALPVVVPRSFFTISPRFDYQLNANHTFVGRYSYSRSQSENDGVGQFSLIERAFDTAGSEHTMQLTETAVVSPRMINETRIQYIHRRNEQNGDNTTPTIQVLDAFTSGGSQIGAAFFSENRWEVQNYSTFTSGDHVMRFGGRGRGVSLTDFSPQNFGGTFLFGGGIAPQLDAFNEPVRDASGNPVLVPITSLERYRRTLLFRHLPQSEIRALGGGPTQFSIASGNPEASVSQVDVGVFFQDEWKLRPNLTVTMGLRYERQSNIDSIVNFAPRLAFAWAPGGGNPTSSQPPGGGGGGPQTPFVIRGGIGVFYDRFSERGSLLVTRFNGINQQDYRVFDPSILNLALFTPDGVSNVPSPDMLAGFAAPQITRRIADNFQAPYSVMWSLNAERQLPYKFTLFAVLFNYRSRHLLRIRNINAPLPGTYDPGRGLTGVRPLGDVGDVHLYESSGSFDDYRFWTGLRRQAGRGISLWANYGTGRARATTDCIFGSFGTCYPADSYDLSGERARVFAQHFMFIGGNIPLPKLKVVLNPFIIGQSGRPFNIITGRDTNGDGLFTERPALATSETAPADLRRTRFGDFDLRPALGQPVIPRNYATGPAFFSVNLNISRTFGFGDVPKSAVAAAPAPTAPPAGTAATASQSSKSEAAKTKTKSANDSSKGSNNASQTSASRPGGGGGAPEKRFNVTLSINIENLFNRVNHDRPNGNLSSPFFGEPTTISNGFFFGGPGGSSIGNRRVRAQIRFNF